MDSSNNINRPARPQKTSEVDDCTIPSSVKKNNISRSQQNTLEKEGISLSKSIMKRRFQECKGFTRICKLVTDKTCHTQEEKRVDYQKPSKKKSSYILEIRFFWTDETKTNQDKSLVEAVLCCGHVWLSMEQTHCCILMI